MAVDRSSAHSDGLLRTKAIGALAPADRNLATALVLGTLRWQIRLDHELAPLLKRPNARLDAAVRVALRMGAFQLRFLDRVPAHAAIDESVELAKASGHRFAAGMVNAVLRRLAAARSQPDPPENTASELALAHSHPLWMVERWVSFYGLEAARAICRHGQAQPPPALRLAAPSVEAELVRAGVQLSPSELLTAARSVAAGDLAATAAFREGRVRFQDEGSQLIAEIAAGAGALSGRESLSILDACAAPGGKTLILAERNPRARIVACEANPQRAERLRDRLAAYAERVECRVADAAALTEDAAFDVALVDAPCSGTGTLGRNPEIRHRLALDDLPRQARRQLAILRAALRAIRPGGQVIYSTCSLEPEENEQVVASAAEAAGIRILSIWPHIAGLAATGALTPTASMRLQACPTPAGSLRLLPGTLGTDGFYVAALQRMA